MEGSLAAVHPNALQPRQIEGASEREREREPEIVITFAFAMTAFRALLPAYVWALHGNVDDPFASPTRPHLATSRGQAGV